MLKIKKIFYRQTGIMIVFELTQMTDVDDYPYIWIPKGYEFVITPKGGKNIEMKEGLNESL